MSEPAPCPHTAANRLHGVCIFCWRDRNSAAEEKVRALTEERDGWERSFRAACRDLGDAVAREEREREAGEAARAWLTTLEQAAGKLCEWVRHTVPEWTPEVDHYLDATEAALSAPSGQKAAPPEEVDGTKVVCPQCVHQFRAIPAQVQRLLLAAGYEPPFMVPAPPDTGERAVSPKVERPYKCPSCESPAPHLHPAVQHEGEVQLCKDKWHASTTRGRDMLTRVSAPQGSGKE